MPLRLHGDGINYSDGNSANKDYIIYDAGSPNSNQDFQQSSSGDKVFVISRQQKTRQLVQPIFMGCLFFKAIKKSFRLRLHGGNTLKRTYLVR